ncbi:hypothetical protein JD844_019349 [Phrynosoma platyrhinos]|uniref:WD repeat-containing protein on Y chromosome n=1 Tax=Phrynosoma platyrhinos TaxID=52577 RepID=A0ABQ7SPU6_PHRPL|nr:hypothetical protein JD844_019349 [Phrynosoma platyrhinos]
MKISDSCDEARSKQLEDQINYDHLRKLERMFREADIDGGGGLDIEEFRKAMKKIMGDISDEDIDVIFMKVDINCDGSVDWEEYLNYMLREYRGKDDMQKSKLLPEFQVNMKRIPVAHAEEIVKIQFFPNQSRGLRARKERSRKVGGRSVPGRFLTVSRDGILHYWTDSFKMLRTVHLDQTKRRHSLKLWVIDMLCLPNINLLAVSTTDQDIEFFDIGGNKCDRIFTLVGLEGCATAMDYWTDGHKGVFCVGDVKGNVLIFTSTDVVMNGLFNVRSYIGGLARVPVNILMKSKTDLYRNFTVSALHGDWCQQIMYIPQLNLVASCTPAEKGAMVLTSLPVHKGAKIQTAVIVLKKGILCFDYSPELNILDQLHLLHELQDLCVRVEQEGDVVPVNVKEHDKIIECKHWKSYHSDDVLCMDGHSNKLLVTASCNGDIVLWNVNSGQAFCRFNATESPLVLLPKREFSVDVEGPMLSGIIKKPESGGDKKCWAYTRTGVPPKPPLPPRPASAIHSSASSVHHRPPGSAHPGSRTMQPRVLFLKTRERAPDNAILLTSCSDGHIYAWAIGSKGGLMGKFRAAHGVSQDTAICSMSTDDKDLVLFTGDSLGYIKIWDIMNYCTPSKGEDSVSMMSDDSGTGNIFCSLIPEYCRIPPRYLVLGAKEQSLWRLGIQHLLPAEVPEEIRRVGSLHTMKVLNEGRRPHWDQQKRQQSMLMDFLHGKKGLKGDAASRMRQLIQKETRMAKVTDEQIEASFQKWEESGKQTSDILGRAYKQKEPRPLLKHLPEVKAYVANKDHPRIYHCMQYADLQPMIAPKMPDVLAESQQTQSTGEQRPKKAKKWKALTGYIIKPTLTNYMLRHKITESDHKVHTGIPLVVSNLPKMDMPLIT